MMKKIRVLVVDDEPETIKYVRANLQVRGYDVLSARDGKEALKLFGEFLIDLVVLDLMMPGMSGFEVCQAIRKQSSVPIIILSARGRERDIVRALDLGADDYLTKPFGVEELLARVRAALRRTSQIEVTSRPPLVIDELTIDFTNRRVTLKENEVKLTRTEYDLLAHLALNAGRIITHRVLLQTVWGPAYSTETEYLWAYVRRLRRKIEADPSKPRFILTHPGVGYSFDSSV